MDCESFEKIHLRRDGAVLDVRDDAVLYVLGGTLELSVCDGEAQNFKLSVGERDIAVLRREALSRLRAVSECECELYRFGGRVPSALFSLEACEKNTLLAFSDKSSDVLWYLEHLREELDSRRVCRDDTLSGLSLCTLSSLVRAMGITEDELARSRHVQKGSSGTHAHFDELADVLRYIDSSLSADIGIEKLASLARMSRSQLYKVFRRHTGMTINEYILRRRVENTIRLLMTTDCSVIEAAYDSGFTSSSGFYKTFRRIAGCSPKEYMKRLGGQSSETYINKISL